MKCLFFILFSVFTFIKVKAPGVKLGFAGNKIPALVDKAGEPKWKNNFGCHFILPNRSLGKYIVSYFPLIKLWLGIYCWELESKRPESNLRSTQTSHNSRFECELKGKNSNSRTTNREVFQYFLEPSTTWARWFIAATGRKKGWANGKGFGMRHWK